MSSEPEAAAEDSTLAAIFNTVQARGLNPAMVEGYVLYAEYLDADGHRCYHVDWSSGQGPTTTLGMTEALRMWAKGHLVDSFNTEEG